MASLPSLLLTMESVDLLESPPASPQARRTYTGSPVWYTYTKLAQGGNVWKLQGVPSGVGETLRFPGEGGQSAALSVVARRQASRRSFYVTSCLPS